MKEESVPYIRVSSKYIQNISLSDNALFVYLLLLFSRNTYTERFLVDYHILYYLAFNNYNFDDYKMNIIKAGIEELSKRPEMFSLELEIKGNHICVDYFFLETIVDDNDYFVELEYKTFQELMDVNYRNKFRLLRTLLLILSFRKGNKDLEDLQYKVCDFPQEYICQAVGMNVGTLEKHINVLEAAQIIFVRRQKWKKDLTGSYQHSCNLVSLYKDKEYLIEYEKKFYCDWKSFKPNDNRSYGQMLIWFCKGKEYSEDILEYVDMYAKQKLKERSENENVARDCNNKVFALLDRYCELRKIVDYN